MDTIRIRYFSKLGHTKKVAEYLAEELGVEAKGISGEDFDTPCKLLFLGGAPYANIMDKELKQYVEKLSKEDVKTVALFTTSNWSRRTVLSIKKTLTGKGITVLPDHLYVHMLAVDGAREKARKFAKDTVTLLDL